MKTFWNYLDGSKTFSAIAILGVLVPLCPVLGVPMGVTYGLTAAATALGIVGRLHAGSELQDEVGKVAELKQQVDVLRQYAGKK